MKKVIYVCDKCKKDFEESLWNVSIARPAPSKEIVSILDFCISCTNELHAGITNKLSGL